MADITIYCTLSCPYCQMAFRLLNSKGVKYKQIRVDGNSAMRNEMEQRSKRTSVPQIFIGNHHVGGFDDLSELDIEGKLDSMLGLTEQR
jgi:glutaredoxin 3